MKPNVGLLTPKAFHDSKHSGGTGPQRDLCIYNVLELDYLASDRTNILNPYPIADSLEIM